MAIFHFSAQLISRSDGANAVQAAAYRAGLRMTCSRTGQVFNFTRKKEVSHRAILAPEGAAPWALCRATLWGRVEEQKRKNAQLAREIVVALPIELTHTQQVALIHRYVEAQFVSLSMVADINIHSKRGNPHVHVLLTLSDIEADGFGAKRRDWNHPSLVARWREAWAKACNAALEEAGHAARIDHRSNKERGIDLPATVHEGRRTHANAEAWDARVEFNAWVRTQIVLAKVQAEVKAVQSQIVDLTSTIERALTERRTKSLPSEARTASTTLSAVPAEAVPSTNARIWTPASAAPPRDFSIAGLLARRAHAVGPSSPIRPAHPSTPQPEVMHASGGIFQGDKPC
ncbi:RepB/MobA-like protein [Acidovorax sp. NO-1]|uniref:MobQ family relaxase n=1 Tax=Acidovorax sp. NO-1 TaxID=512030 RepID=UPI00023FCA8E|nr:MobQ family relaxase [Acidovorax sp. NO-1]EHL24149.1 RepB/MobA-like protein [Acidovorax sp. NO-1]